MTRGWESVQGTLRGFKGKVAGVSADAGSTGPGGRRMWGGLSPSYSATAPHPILAGSKLPGRPLTPGLHNFQGMSQISEFSGRHLKKETGYAG